MACFPTNDSMLHYGLYVAFLQAGALRLIIPTYTDDYRYSLSYFKRQQLRESCIHQSHAE